MAALDHLIARTLPLVPRPIVRHFAGRYIAGESLADAVRVLRDLNGDGYMATLDVLGEEVRNRALAEGAVKEYLGALRTIQQERLDSNLSVKLTQLGLKIDPEFCLDNTRTLVRQAETQGNFVRIDMEDSSCTSATLDLYRRLREEGLNSVGVVIQACLHRSLADVRALPEGANVRLCKGIYIEPRAIAYRDRGLVRKNYVRLLEEMLDRGFCVGIATHDEDLVWEALRIIDLRRLPNRAYEFQMLLGVDPELRGLIVRGGHRLRVYVPYGSHWYAYSLRRLKENPRLAGYVLLNLVRRHGS
ncbi:MAG: proline dehydrogenase family protein [Acidobacteria bacterium]|nr:proline dehydrogenase family protein [Acidobacteriota bacterium]